MAVGGVRARSARLPFTLVKKTHQVRAAARQTLNISAKTREDEWILVPVPFLRSPLTHGCTLMASEEQVLTSGLTCFEHMINYGQSAPEATALYDGLPRWSASAARAA